MSIPYFLIKNQKKAVNHFKSIIELEAIKKKSKILYFN